MARIYFHTPTRTVEVRDCERYLVHDLEVKIMAAIIVDPFRQDTRERFAPFLSDAQMAKLDADRHGWHEAFRKTLESSYGLEFEIDGMPVPSGMLAANTLIAMGSPMAVLARMMHTCEDFAFIDTTDAEWFADTLQEACELHIVRGSTGWYEVIELARVVASGLAGPIVTSYSVCDQFPNPDVAKWKAPRGQCVEEAWYDLPAKEQWRLAEKGMRKRQHNRQISPSTLIRFASGHTAFDLCALAKGNH